MGIIGKLAIAIMSYLSFGAVRKFFDKYEILVADKEDILDDNEQDSSLDLRGTPTHVCVCGCDVWFIRASFDNYEISTYFLDMQCYNCGNIATAPTPLDRERLEP